MVGWLRIVGGAIGLSLTFAAAIAEAQDRPGPVGLRQIAFADGERTIALSMFYPARNDGATKPFFFPFFVNVSVLPGAPPLSDGARRPLIVLSHGRGSNGLLYAWFAQYLAERGFVVAAIDHCRANTYDSNIVYLANKLWQRPVDIGLAISFLLREPAWAGMIDPDRIGVAGHSQGGFTALWIGGAEVSAEGYLAFQRAGATIRR